MEITTTKKETQSKGPSEAQLKAAVIRMEKIIKGGINEQSVTYDELNGNILTITFKPEGSNKEFTILYSYTFKNFERNTQRFLISGFLSAKDEELKIDYLKD